MPMLEGLSPEILSRRRPFVKLLNEAAIALGGRIEMETTYGHLGRYHGPDGTSRVIFGNALGLNSDSAAALAADKDYTARLLHAEGLPSPQGILIFSAAYVARMELKNNAVAQKLPRLDAARVFADQAGYPVIIKPNTGSEGRGVCLASTPDQLISDLNDIFETDDRVRIEPRVSGQDHRVMVFDGKVVAAYRREPIQVIGTGQQRLSDLISARLAALAEQHRGSKLSPTDPRILRSLASQGLGMDSIPDKGHIIALLTSANLSTGGVLRDLTGQIAPAAEIMAIDAAKTLGLRLAGVDIIAPDLTHGTDGATILEVNSAPGLDYYASAGPTQWDRALKIVKQLLNG